MSSNAPHSPPMGDAEPFGRFASLFQFMPEPLVLMKVASGEIVDVNDAWCEWSGYRREEAIGRTAAQLDLASSQERERIKALFKGRPELRNVRVHYRRRDGQLRNMSLSIRRIELDGETHSIVAMRDESELEEALVQLRERREMLALTLQAARLGAWDWDVGNSLVDGDERWRELLDLPREPGPVPGELLSARIHPDEALKAREERKAFRWSTDGQYDISRRLLRLDGSDLWIRNIGRVIARNADGNPTRVLGVTMDVTREREHEAHLARSAQYDLLTGLPNRQLLGDRLEQAMAHARRSGSALGVAYLDLDGFKPINDTHGHAMGDRLLVEAARRMRDTSRAIDTAARVGGDEFVLLIGSLESEDRGLLALERVMEALSAPYRIEGIELQVTASIGVTFYPKDDADGVTLMRHADQAMYHAKQGGRNQIRSFDAGREQAQLERQRLLARLAVALDEGEFELYLQPKVDLRAGRVVGAEALARWRHPERGILAPLEFLPVVEGSALDLQFGDWVLTEAFRLLDAWAAGACRWQLAVNLSALHLQSSGLVARVTELLAQNPAVAPDRLELEVTESAALSDVRRVGAVTDALRALGVSVALDDFGTGYASLAYLRRLPVDTLKIDQSFVRGMVTDAGDRAIVQAVIALAHSFGRQVVAEGVETAEHGEKLLALGATIGQGYCVARPMPANEFAAWCAAWVPPASWA